MNGKTIGTVEIVSEPRDEIAEVWENTVALAAIAGATSLVMIGILYFVLGRVLDPLTALGKGLEGLEHRDYKMRLARPKVLEFAAITDRFNALAGALDAARAENLALSRRLVTAQDDERRSTALELHDEVGPSLFGLKANTASIAKAADALPDGAAKAIRDRTADLTAIIEHLQSLNRSILNRLRPMALGHVPLPEILSELVRERAGSHPNIGFSARRRHAGAELRRYGGPDALSLRAGKPHQCDPPRRGDGGDGECAGAPRGFRRAGRRRCAAGTDGARRRPRHRGE